MELILGIVVVLLLVGLLLFGLSYMPLDPAIMSLIRGVLIFGVVIWIILILTGSASVPHFRLR